MTFTCWGEPSFSISLYSWSLFVRLTSLSGVKICRFMKVASHIIQWKHMHTSFFGKQYSIFSINKLLQYKPDHSIYKGGESSSRYFKGFFYVYLHIHLDWLMANYPHSLNVTYASPICKHHCIYPFVKNSY